jgi:hypothetical protein
MNKWTNYYFLSLASIPLKLQGGRPRRVTMPLAFHLIYRNLTPPYPTLPHPTYRLHNYTVSSHQPFRYWPTESYPTLRYAGIPHQQHPMLSPDQPAPKEAARMHSL